jgi:hypothetical protein
LNIVNPAADKPVSFLNAMLFKMLSWDIGVRLVMRRPFWVVRGIAVFDRAGRSR